MIWNILALVLLLVFKNSMSQSDWNIAMIVNAIVFVIGAIGLFKCIHAYRIEQIKAKERIMAKVKRAFGD